MIVAGTAAVAMDVAASMRASLRRVTFMSSLYELRARRLTRLQRFESGLLHYRARRVLAGPQFELPRRLFQKHLEPADYLRSLALRLADQRGFERIVDHVEHQFGGN